MVWFELNCFDIGKKLINDNYRLFYMFFEFFVINLSSLLDCYYMFYLES